jgi:hypothetical protein
MKPGKRPLAGLSSEEEEQILGDANCLIAEITNDLGLSKSNLHQ